MTDEDHNDSCGIDRSWSYACRGWSKAWTFSGCVIQRSQCQLRDREPKRLLHQAQCCAFHCTDNIDNIQSFQTLVTWACVKPWRIQRPVCIEKGISRSWSSESGWIMLNPTAHSVTAQAQRMKDAEDARPGSKTLRASWPRGYAELWRRSGTVYCRQLWRNAISWGPVPQPATAPVCRVCVTKSQDNETISTFWRCNVKLIIRH